MYLFAQNKNSIFIGTFLYVANFFFLFHPNPPMCHTPWKHYNFSSVARISFNVASFFCLGGAIVGGFPCWELFLISFFLFFSGKFSDIFVSSIPTRYKWMMPRLGYLYFHWWFSLTSKRFTAVQTYNRVLWERPTSHSVTSFFNVTSLIPK